MADDAYYRQVLRQMQDEFARAVAALEKQVGALSQHNALLTAELRHTQQQQQNWVQEANNTVSTLQNELRGQAASAETAQREAVEREQALTHEVAALKSLLQQEQDYWVRHDQATKENVDRLTRQLAEAKADVFQHHDRNQALRREMRVLQSRVDVAVQTNASFEQRLTAVVQEKQQAMQEVENQLLHYKKRLHEKRAQTKYLTEALVRLQEQRESSGNNSSSSNGSSPTTIPSSSRPTARLASSPVPSASTMETRNQLMTEPTQQPRRVRKRETGLTLPDEIKAAAATVSTSSRLYKSKRLASSRAGTSPMSSSPEVSPRTAPYKRAPSVATTTPTTADGNSFNSNSSSNGSLRSMRSMRSTSGRTISSRHKSGSDHIDVSPTATAGVLAAGTSNASPTSGRLERELSGLRRKLDACMTDVSGRW